MDRQILEYLPRILRDVQEVLGYTDGQQWAFDQAWRQAERAMDNQFILDADDYGLSRWEKMLNIVPRAGDSLDTRRARILLRLREKLPFTLRMLRRHLEELCGEEKYSAEIKRATYILTVMIDLTSRKYVDDVMELLVRMVPANLLFKLYVLSTAEEKIAPLGFVPAGHGGFSRTDPEERDIYYAFSIGQTLAVLPFQNGAYSQTSIPPLELSPVFRGSWETGIKYRTITEKGR